MKKLALLSIPALIVATFLIGCTLSMEEYIVPEEKKGFDEPLTVENEFGSCTYQYNEGVKPITRNVQEYLVRVVDDTILYFMDTTPRDWLPEAGGYVSASGSRKLPYGLNHRVKSIDNENGMYKVVLVGATRAEVFKEFNCSIDYDYVMPQYLPIDSLDYEQSDSLDFIDFSLVDDEEGGSSLERTIEYKKAVRKGVFKTRAKDPSGDQYDQTNIKIPVKVDLEHVMFLITGKKNPKLEGVSLEGSYNYHKGNRTRIRLIERKSDDYRKYTTENFDTSRHTINIGLNKELKKYDFAELSKNNDSYKEQVDLLKAMYIEDRKNKIGTIESFKKFASGNKKARKPGHFVLVIPAFPAVSLVLDISGGASINVLGYGTVEWQNIEPRKLKGYIYNHGEKVNIDEVVQEASSSLTKLAFGGEFRAEANIRVGAGVELSGAGLGATIGVGAAVGVHVLAQSDISNWKSGTHYILYDNENLMEAYVNWTVDAAAYLSPAGFTLGTISWLIYEGNLWSKSYHFKPVLDRKRIAKKWKYEKMIKLDEDGNYYTERELVFDNSFGWSNLWLFDQFQTSANGIPGVRVYHGSYEGKYKDFPIGWDWNSEYDFEEVIEKGDTRFHYQLLGVSPNKTYNVKFRYSDLLSKENKYYVVPCIYNLQYHYIEEYRDAKNEYKFSKPTMEPVKGSFKWSALPAITEYNEETFRDEFGKGNVDKYNVYRFQYTFLFKNPELIKSWGVEVRLWRGDKEVMRKIVPMDYVEEQLIPSGKKSAKITFITDYTPEDGRQDVWDGFSANMRPIATLYDGSEVKGEWATNAGAVWMAFPHIWAYNDKGDGDVYSVTQKQTY